MNKVNLDAAIIYDIEAYPNVFTLHMECLNNDFAATWEISEFRDDRRDLMHWFQWLAQTQTVMIGFNSIGYDYPVIDFIFRNPYCTVAQIYDKSMSIINSFADRFGHVVWASDRFAPQCDLFKIYHMDNNAKSTSLKALQINMRSASVVDAPIEFGTYLTREQTNELLIPYNKHDVSETKQFAKFSMEAINFRLSLVDQFGIDVLNFPDTKIGSKIMEQRLGDELCYDRSTGRKQTRQTPRSRIALKDIILPYIYFNQPEFQRVHQYLNSQVLTSDEISQIGSDQPAKIKTKGVFTGLTAHVGGIDFHFGTGGMHGSVSSQRIVATNEWIVRDIDVAALYPSFAIVNRLAPAHLGERFTEEYSKLPLERKKWQKEKHKKCVEANTLKLASNGVYGNSNSAFSVFYDPQYTLTTTVNCQLIICMLAEWLLTVPTLKIIQINTDGITYYIHRDHEPHAVKICKQWEDYTKLTLEDANYSRMFIRDVNSYIAEGMDGSQKLKGAYWSPDPLDYANSISTQQPPAWHKDLGNCVSIRAAVAAMIHGVHPETYIRLCTNPFDFMCRIKVKKSDVLMLDNRPVQKTSRYYVSTNGGQMVKSSPPTGQIGAFKKKNGVSDGEYARVMAETQGRWDARVCTKNESRYEQRATAIEAGHRVTLCNNVRDFSFDNVNYAWYVGEAIKLVI